MVQEQMNYATSQPLASPDAMPAQADGLAVTGGDTLAAPVQPTTEDALLGVPPELRNQMRDLVNGQFGALAQKHVNPLTGQLEEVKQQLGPVLQWVQEQKEAMQRQQQIARSADDEQAINAVYSDFDQRGLSKDEADRYLGQMYRAWQAEQQAVTVAEQIQGQYREPLAIGMRFRAAAGAVASLGERAAPLGITTDLVAAEMARTNTPPSEAGARGVLTMLLAAKIDQVRQGSSAATLQQRGADGIDALAGGGTAGPLSVDDIMLGLGQGTISFAQIKANRWGPALRARGYPVPDQYMP